ncbi:MAG TPA: VOC family protein [Chitinophagaceae bacterium]|nr:VOC family protein [Chitinophagaceae bacterium]
MDQKKSIDIRFLDHVAIRVKDLTISADWYQKVLGLKKNQAPEWGEFPSYYL